MELPNIPTKDPYREIPVKDFSYVNTKKHPLANDKKNKVILITLSCMLLVLLGAGAYFYGYYSRDNKKKQVSSSSSPVVKIVSNNIYSPETTSYSSSAFGFNINYPDSWQVSSSTTTSVELSSPVVSLTSDTGKELNGKVVMSVVNQGQIPASFGSSSVAVLDSVDLSFNNPTASQAAQSYLSFIQYPATVVKGGLDGIYLTGNNGYLKDDTIPSSDINQMSPLIYLSFLKCNNSACTSSSPLSISSTMWSNSNFSKAITDTIKSLTFS
jgi:hypothetical protein